MKLIIAGSRSIKDYTVLCNAIAQSDFCISEVVSGCARGVDKLGERWASERNLIVTRMRADWGRFGQAAGLYRNSEMASYADAAIILWDGESRGTLHMIDCMRRAGKPFEVYDDQGILIRTSKISS